MNTWDLLMYKSTIAKHCVNHLRIKIVLKQHRVIPNDSCHLKINITLNVNMMPAHAETLTILGSSRNNCRLCVVLYSHWLQGYHDSS